MQKNNNTQQNNQPGKTCNNKRKSIFFSILRIVITFLIVFPILFFIKTPYMYESPGSCEDTSNFIKIKGVKKFNTHGKFFITTVIYERANILLFLYGKVNPEAELIYKKERSKKNEKQRNNYMVQQMDDSKLKAKISAFRTLGYDIKIKKGPVRVLNIKSWSNAKDILKVGDAIIEAQGKPVKTEDELIDIVKSTPIEQPVELIVLRSEGKGKNVKEKEMKISVPLTEIDGVSKIGIQILAKIESADLPFDVTIESSNIVGASAGMMFSLEIMKRVSGVDLTGGYRIAGTGSVDEDGNVIKIEGVKYKVMISEKTGCRYFLCPEKNFEDAKNAAKTIKVLPVKNLKDALARLKKINPSSNIDRFIKKD